jgi:hypothetical protein
MSTRRSDRDVTSSLFPFLSVLACVIGTLTLLIAALALGQLAQDLLTERNQPLREQELEEQTAALLRAEALLEEADRVHQERAAAEAELRHLGIRPEASEKERRRSVETRLTAPRIAQRLATLRREETELDAAVIGARTALVAERPGKNSGRIRILPHGSARPLLPFFVECRKEGVRVYTKTLRESYYLSRGTIEDTAEFRRYVQRIRNVRRATIIFLIRGDGVETYHWAANMVGRSYVRHAKLPLPGDGDLEFAL